MFRGLLTYLTDRRFSLSNCSDTALIWPSVIRTATLVTRVLVALHFLKRTSNALLVDGDIW